MNFKSWRIIRTNCSKSFAQNEENIWRGKSKEERERESAYYIRSYTSCTSYLTILIYFYYSIYFSSFDKTLILSNWCYRNCSSLFSFLKVDNAWRGGKKNDKFLFLSFGIWNFHFHPRIISSFRAVYRCNRVHWCNRVNGEHYRDTHTLHLAHMDTMLEKRSFNELTRLAQTHHGFCSYFVPGPLLASV